MLNFNTKAELLDALSAIPDDQWCIGDYTKGTSHCALGHLGFRDPLSQDDYRINHDIDKKLRRVIPTWNFDTLHLVNDGHIKQFPQPTPKARVIAYINSL